MREDEGAVLVTGGTGFLGRRVVPKLLSLGYRLVLLGPAGAEGKLDPLVRDQVTYLAADLTVPAELTACREHLAGCRKILHLAGRVRFIADQPSVAAELLEEVRVNVLGLLNLLAILPRGIRHFLFASSCSVYGAGEAALVGEDACTYPATPYGASKLAGEIYLRHYCQAWGIPLTILRFTQLYGRGEPHGQFLTRFLRQCREGAAIQLFNRGQDVRDLLHVEDAAEAVIKAITLAKPGIFNIASGKGLTTEELGRACAAVTGTNPEIQLVAGSEAKTIVYDIRAARQALGFAPKISLLAGLREMIEEEREH